MVSLHQTSKRGHAVAELHSLPMLDPRVWTRRLRFKTLPSPMRSKLVSRSTPATCDPEQTLSSAAATCDPERALRSAAVTSVGQALMSGRTITAYGLAQLLLPTVADTAPTNQRKEFHNLGQQNTGLRDNYAHQLDVVERLLMQHSRRVHTFLVRRLPSSVSWFAQPQALLDVVRSSSGTLGALRS